ncbi:hypothetical protein GmarT_45380 [Gimesia maris]|uniref:Uncharacterized protein n=2 Tax=Gimesia maris TaxID=122 RepID=A0ABX5YSL7_9PLAN|nr:hypothetical protein Mal35_43650 [Gimesia maris]QDU16608.1 hypothetical protein CA11_44400 [Gimesia maris]QEG18648.1 hypothetical protein GmarT_45380 [Gimesia maris]|tara:strand:+ start:76283 stop:76705 length:423 start_codon:yes stop_codon:yes gene_type:complete
MPAPPSWLKTMANQVASLMYDVDMLSPIGCHFFHNGSRNEWEVTLFASSTEIVGGEWDGVLAPSKFCFNILKLGEIFEEVESLYWQALPVDYDDQLGCHISIEGMYEGERVWVRVLAEAPEEFEAGRRMQAYEFNLKEIW